MSSSKYIFIIALFSSNWIIYNLSFFSLLVFEIVYIIIKLLILSKNIISSSSKLKIWDNSKFIDELLVFINNRLFVL
jgi:hypothetical protein